MTDNMPTPQCPDCHRDLEKVRYQGGYLNEGQFDSVRAGDWFCEGCPYGNGKRYRYFWNRDVLKPADPVGEIPTKTPADHAAECIAAYTVGIALRMKDGPFDRVPQEEVNAYAAMRDALAALGSAPPLTGTPNE